MRVRAASVLASALVTLLTAGCGKGSTAAEPIHIAPIPTATITPTATRTATATPTPSVSINGLYDLGDPGSTSFAPSVLTNSSVDGLAMRTTWKTLEPADGSFDWSEIDAAIAIAQANGKKVSIGVTPGVQSPAWLWTEGVQPFVYKWNQSYGGFAYCQNVSLPVPWDPIYEVKWGAFIAAFGARYSSNPYVSHVKLTGVNGPTSETTLPRTVYAQINNGQCVGDNDVQDWINLGYTRTKVEDAWELFAAEFNAAFPQKEFAGIFSDCPNGLPPIDENGNVIPAPLVIARARWISSIVASLTTAQGDSPRKTTT